MSWTFQIARVFGVAIKIHVTFVLILALGAAQWGGTYGATGAMFGALLMALLFVCVALHELVHSAVAKHFGVPVDEIVLYPFGGVASLKKRPEKPAHELWIALAGPTVNVVIALLLLLVTRATVGFAHLDGEEMVRAAARAPSVTAALMWLFSANVVLAVFNMIPAFPMDGGRVLRALLAMRMGRHRATQIAALVGQIIATAMGIWGVLSGNFILAFVALFIFLGASGERADEQASRVLHTLRVGDAYNKHALTLTPGDRVSRVVDYILTSYQPDFAVLLGNQLLGVVTRNDVLRALAEGPDDVYVASIMQRDVMRVDADVALDEVRRVLAEHGRSVAAVIDRQGTFLGLVSQEDIGEALLVATFVQRQAEMRAVGQT